MATDGTSTRQAILSFAIALLAVLLIGGAVFVGPRLLRAPEGGGGGFAGSGGQASARGLAAARSLANAGKAAVPGKLTMARLADRLSAAPGDGFADAFWADPALSSAWKDFEADGDAEKFQRQAAKGSRLELLSDRFGGHASTSASASGAPPAAEGGQEAAPPPQDSLSMITGGEGVVPASAPPGQSSPLSGQIGADAGAIAAEAAAGIADRNEKTPNLRGKDLKRDLVPKAEVPEIETIRETGTGRVLKNEPSRRKRPLLIPSGDPTPR